MRTFTLSFALIGCALLAACGGQQTATTSQSNSNSTAQSAQTSTPPNGAETSGVGVVASHGGGNTTAGGSTTAAPSGDKPPVATPELDAKIEKALAKANAKGATTSDKKAAADAYKDRADYYWGAGNVMLYKYALGDYRRVLRYDPANDEAKERIDYLISVYHSLNRPVPDNGLEN